MRFYCIKKYWNENVCFQITSEIQFKRHISDGNLSRIEYAIKIINITMDLIPPPQKPKLCQNCQDTSMMMLELPSLSEMLKLIKI